MIKNKKQPRVYIIILNWNNHEDTIELIQSLKKISYNNYKIIVIDNNSSEKDVVNLFENSKEEIQLIINKENLGFSGGNNIGIKLSIEEGADFILLLNNDTIVNTNFLDLLVEKFEHNNQIGIVAPQINFYDNPKKIWSGGGKISKIRGSGFIYSNSDQIKNSKEIDFVSGCCMLIKKDVFQKIGLFDENYFLYIEDTDFCYRVIKNGYKICFTPESQIYHKVFGSTKKSYSALPLYYSTRNRLYFARKNFPGLFPLTLLYISITMFFKCLIWLFKGELNKINSVKKGFRDFLAKKMGKMKLISN